MLDSFGESRLRTLGLGKGTPEALKELGQLTGYLRHHLSSAVIWANVRCLLSVCEGVGQAGTWKEEAVGKAGGGEGEVGERGTVAGKVEWEEPCFKGRFPLSLDIDDFEELMITFS